MIAMHWAMTDTTVLAATRRGKTPAFLLFGRYLHMFLLPKPMDPGHAHDPSRLNQQRMNATAAESRPTIRNLSHRFQQWSILFRELGLIPLRAARLIQHPASTPLTDPLMPQTTTDPLDGTTPSLGVYKFGRAASFKINISNAWSATSFFNRVFSFSSSFNCLAIAGSIPPYF